jgi:hypothetical protein
MILGRHLAPIIIGCLDFREMNSDDMRWCDPWRRILRASDARMRALLIERWVTLMRARVISGPVQIGLRSVGLQ